MRIKNLLFSLCLALTLGGCSGGSSSAVELKLVDNYHGEYEVGFPIDVENFFYYSDRSQVSISASYNKNGLNVTDEILGNVFYPKYSGDYLFTCASSTKSLNKRITVVDSKPTLTIKDAAAFVSTGKEIYFVEIFGEISPDYSPSTADLQVYNVQYAPYTFDISQSLTKPLVDYDFTNVGFTPKNPGLYRVCVRVTNGTKSVDGVINVVAANSKNDGNENVYKLDDGTYASNKVIVDETAKDTFVLPASIYAEASYVTLKPLFQNGDSIGIRFKGKNIPSVGLLATHSRSGSYAINSITGYLLSFERRFTNRYSLYCPMNGTTYKDGQASRDELLGVDDLDENTYYYLTAALVGNTPSGSKKLHAVHWSICEIIDYGTINEHYSEPIKKIDQSGGWTDDYDVKNGRVVLYSSEKRDITVQIDGLPDQKDYVQFGGRKHEGINHYTFENSTTKADKVHGNTATVNGYFAYKGIYSSGDSVSFTFKGYNIPGVVLFADTISGLTGGAKGLYICPGSGDITLNKRLTFYGPYRLDSSNPDGYISYDGVTTYDNIFWNYRVYNHGRADKSDVASPFSYDSLYRDGDYLYTIKIIKATENNVVIGALLYDKHNGDYELVANDTFYIHGYAGPVSGHIIAYPNFTSMAKTTTFSSYPINTSPLTERESFSYRSSYEVNGNATSVHIDAPVFAQGDMRRLQDISYLGLKDVCEVDQTIKINFTGKNIPNVCLFADSIDGQAIGGGHGVYLSTSFQNINEESPKSGNGQDHYVMPYAPYRWSPTNGIQNKITQKSYDKAKLDDLTHFRYKELATDKNVGYGYLDAVDGTKYEYKIKTNSFANGSINLTLSIGTVDNLGNVTVVNTKTFTLDLLSHVSLGENIGLGSDLIFYGQGAAVDFTYTIE